MENGILIAVFVIAFFIVLRMLVKRFGVKRKCCGGKKTEKREGKTLDFEPIFEVTVCIDGLCCEDCAIRLENAFNRMNGVAANACHKAKSVVLLLGREFDEAEIRAVVSGCGFVATDIRTKKI